MAFIEIPEHRRARYLRNCRALALLSAITGGLYLKWLLFDARPDNHVLFYMLIGAEIFNLIQAAGFWFTISRQRWPRLRDLDFRHTRETVDIFITVCGEPLTVVGPTIAAALRIRHPRARVWVLDDGKSLDLKELAAILGAGYLTRDDRKGAKAGNINAALRRTDGDFVVILDADHVPEPQFLERTLAAFTASDIAFVQTPQVYENRFENRVASGAHFQQALFYGPILRGKNSSDAVFSCGTNVVFRRSALDAIGGMPEDSITEDLRAALLLLDRGYTSVYLPEVLAKGLGPNDVSGFFKQQFRWARGGLEILLKKHPFSFHRRLSTNIQYSLGFVYWFTGWAYLVYLVLPFAYLVLGQRPVEVPNQYPVYFLPYLAATLVTLAYASDFRITFSALWFTLAAFPVHIAAFFSALFGRDARFVVTSKEEGKRDLRPVIAHVGVMLMLAAAAVYGFFLEGFSPSYTNNLAFAVGHILILQGFVRYAWRARTLPDEVPEIDRIERSGGTVDMREAADEIA